MELEPSVTHFEPIVDRRPRMEQPLPVRLISVADCVLSTPAGLERALDAFYVGILRMQRDVTGELDGRLVYRSENFRLRFEIVERPEIRDNYRPVGILIPSLEPAALKFREMGIEFEYRRRIPPGMEYIVLYDPAGNPLEINEMRLFS